MPINKMIEYKGFRIISKGYNKKIYKGDKLIANFTDTIVGAKNYINQLPSVISNEYKEMEK